MTVEGARNAKYWWKRRCSDERPPQYLPTSGKIWYASKTLCPNFGRKPYETFINPHPQKPGLWVSEALCATMIVFCREAVTFLTCDKISRNLQMPRSKPLFGYEKGLHPFWPVQPQAIDCGLAWNRLKGGFIWAVYRSTYNWFLYSCDSRLFTYVTRECRLTQFGIPTKKESLNRCPNRFSS